jgi:tripartite-type tricarboxylate transporter receptor subunit TctC
MLGCGAVRCSSLAPDLPTIAETPGLAGPAGMPPEVVARLNDAFNKVMAMPALQRKLVEGGLEPTGGTAEEFKRVISDEIAKWGKVAKDVGAKAD